MHREKEITPMLVFAIFSSVLGMFQFGYNTGVINAPQKVLEEFIANVYKSRTGDWMSEERRDVIWSLTVSMFAVGGMIGGILAPNIADWCGRKTGLVLNNTFAVIGITLMSSSQLSQSIECLIIGRFFIGLNCGLNTALVPMYLTEIATVNMRGALGTVSQLGVTLGLLFSQVLGLKDILGTRDLWPLLFGFAFIPTLLQLSMLPFCPESPRYLLLTCGRVSEARFALRRLRNSTDIEDDIEEMRAEERASSEEFKKYGKLDSVRELFHHPWLKTPLMIGIMMQLSQQLSGINAIFYYSTDIFQSAEVPENYAVYATMGVGAIMVLMTLVSLPLMDRLGRRTLHLYGLAGMFLASIFLTISLLVKFLYDWMKYISVISILFYTLFFGIGPSSIPFMITAELFTQASRPAAMSVSVLVNWFSNFVVGLTFPLMKRLLQSYLFLPFTVFLAIFWIFTYKKLPETKNRTFEEIASLFRPFQLATSCSGLDYGCSLASIALGDNRPPITPASPSGLLNGPLPPTPGIDGGAPSSAGPIMDGIACGASSYKATDRFRFDTPSATLGRRSLGANQFFDDYPHGLGRVDTHAHHHHQGGSAHQHYHHQHEPRHQVGFQRSDSQGNFQHAATLPHSSCTSIAQNISTSDQQPLIIDMQTEHSCYRSHNHGPHYTTTATTSSHRSNHGSHHYPYSHFKVHSSSTNLTSSNHHKDGCCHKTSSFMAGGMNSRQLGSRGCCDEPNQVAHARHNLESRTSFGCVLHHDDDEIEMDEGDQRKSRTLTRVYKPLNDMHQFQSTSTHNLSATCEPVAFRLPKHPDTTRESNDLG